MPNFSVRSQVVSGKERFIQAPRVVIRELDGVNDLMFHGDRRAGFGRHFVGFRGDVNGEMFFVQGHELDRRLVSYRYRHVDGNVFVDLKSADSATRDELLDASVFVAPFDSVFAHVRERGGGGVPFECAATVNIGLDNSGGMGYGVNRQFRFGTGDRFWQLLLSARVIETTGSAHQYDVKYIVLNARVGGDGRLTLEFESRQANPERRVTASFSPTPESITVVSAKVESGCLQFELAPPRNAIAALPYHLVQFPGERFATLQSGLECVAREGYVPYAVEGETFR